MSHNCFPFAHVIIKLYTKTPHELRMCLIDFGVKRLKVKVRIDSWKYLIFTPMTMKLHTQIPIESRTCPNDNGLKKFEAF